MCTSGSVAVPWSGGKPCPAVLLDGLWELSNPDWRYHVSHYPHHVVESGSRHNLWYLGLAPGSMNKSVEESCWCGLATHQGVLSLHGAPGFPMLPGSKAGPYSLCFCINNPGNLQIHPGISHPCSKHSTPCPVVRGLSRRMLRATHPWLLLVFWLCH